MAIQLVVYDQIVKKKLEGFHHRSRVFYSQEALYRHYCFQFKAQYFQANYLDTYISRVFR